MLGINLQKGESLDLIKHTPGLEKVRIACGWDMKRQGASMDADLMALLLTTRGRVRTQKDIIFFNNKGNQGDPIWHSGDNLTGGGDDEVINVDLSKIPSEIEKITFILNIYQAAQKNQSLADLDNAFIRVINVKEDKEIANFKVTKQTGTNIVYCHLKRNSSGWDFMADGHTDNNTLEQIITFYS